MKKYKGIIVAGGLGVRLYPLTAFVSKQLLPVYNKPLFYYPLTSLILAGIKDILIISTPSETPTIRSVLGNGNTLGLNIEYAEQKYPKGIADALLLSKDFIHKSNACVVLGDNIIYKHDFSSFILQAFTKNTGASIFGFTVNNSKRFGVINLNKENQEVISLEEKPFKTKSNLASVGLYIYDTTFIDRIQHLKPSKRGELEINDLNISYLKENKLKCYCFSKGDLWIDAGLFDSLLDASFLIRVMESYMGITIGCPEEASYMVGNISRKDFLNIINQYKESEYKQYLKNISKNWK